MSCLSTFDKFADLPLELRLMIWEHALSGWTVLALGPHCDCAASTFIAVGPAPHLAGLACVESRQLLKQSYAKFPFQHKRECNVSGVSWVNMGRTVLCLDESSLSVDLPNLFAANASINLRIKHVVLRWTMGWIGPIARACQLLATLPSAIQTIVIQTAKETKEGTIVDESWFTQSILVSTAAYYSTIPDYDGPEMVCGGIDCAHLRAHLLRGYIHPAPKMHILPPVSEDGSE